MIGRTSEGVLILAIKSSCDETTTAAVKNGRTVLSNVISSQIATHTAHGGVVPEIASQEHIRTINHVIGRALAKAQVALKGITAIDVTYGPSLVGALLVGVAGAKAIAYAAGKPLIGVHHIERHISANSIENQDLRPLSVCLIVSGGHTHLVVVKDYGEFEIVGRTRDDAAGGASDKVARSVNPGYPSKPGVDEAAKEGSPHTVQFSRNRVEGTPYGLDFNGLESTVLSHISHTRMTGEGINVPDLVALFQNLVVESLVSHAILIIHESRYEKLAIIGGVISSSALRRAVTEACEKDGIQFHYPSPIFCMDNTTMIGTATYYEYLRGDTSEWSSDATPNLKLGRRQDLSEI